MPQATPGTGVAVALTVLMNAGPWLPVPPPGYGGIENVVATLSRELRRRGVRVVFAGALDSRIEDDGRVGRFEAGRFRDLAAPYPQVMGVAHAHMQAVVAELDARDDIDLVHDHLEVVGAAVLAALGPDGPPALQTLHWDLRKHPEFYGSFDGRGRVAFNALSRRQLAQAPSRLRRQVLGIIPLAVPLDELAFQPEKGDRVLALGRITPVKGVDVAARVCRSVGIGLDVAGPVAGLRDAGELEGELARPGSGFRDRADVRHWLEDVRQHVDGERVRWIGSVDGEAKTRLVGRARALVCPVRWEEPGATAAVEALACGTPVIAARRGAFADIVEDGVTGFLVDDERALAAALHRVDEIDPAACRAAAETRFSPAVMADTYLGLYERILSRRPRTRESP